MTKEDYIVKDINLASKGEVLIEWVSKWMPVLNSLFEKYKEPGIFKNKKIALCIHLEAKTAYLAFLIKKLGAGVWITSSNSLSTKDEVAAALAERGVFMFLQGMAASE